MRIKCTNKAKFRYFMSLIQIREMFVSVDENEKRRDIVRKKTAKYLVKAESLHIKYLAGGESTDHWDVSLFVLFN